MSDLSLRDQQGLEIDFVVPPGDRRLTFIEAKASRTITPAMAEPMRRLRHAARAYRVSGVVIHRSGRYPSSTSALAEGMTTVPVEQLPAVLSVTRQRSDS